MRSFWILLLIFCFAGLAFGQVDGDNEITVDSSVVRLNVGVVNSSGRPITSLSQRSFAVYEDGVRQDILHFEPVAAPFSVVMILDMSGSTLGFRPNIRLSAARFIDALSPTDRVAVIEFYDKINVLNDFTADREKIIHSISVANGKGKTQLYGAMDEALKRLAKEGSRRKAVIVLTDGVDTLARNKDRQILQAMPDGKIPDAINPEESTELSDILAKAARQGVTVYPLALPTGDPAKLADPTPIQIEMYSVARKRLNLLATRTGGQFNAINRLEEMAVLYARVAANVRSLYTIEYQPKNDKRDGKWREIRLEINMPDLIYTTRPGYFAK